MDDAQRGSLGGRKETARVDIRIGSKRGRKAEFKGVEDRIREAIAEKKSDWRSDLVRKPSSFESVERKIHNAFRGFADELVAGLLSEVTQRPEFQTRAKN
jgi:hypothetical protein